MLAHYCPLEYVMNMFNLVTCYDIVDKFVSGASTGRHTNQLHSLTIATKLLSGWLLYISLSCWVYLLKNKECYNIFGVLEVFDVRSTIDDTLLCSKVIVTPTTTFELYSYIHCYLYRSKLRFRYAWQDRDIPSSI